LEGIYSVNINKTLLKNKLKTLKNNTIQLFVLKNTLALPYNYLFIFCNNLKKNNPIDIPIKLLKSDEQPTITDHSTLITTLKIKQLHSFLIIFY